VSAVPPSGLLAACTDDPGAARTLSSFAGPRLSYGIGQDAELRAEGVRLDGRASEFTVRDGARVLGPVRLGVPGLHNVRNALGAFAAARFAGAGFAAAQSALPEFRGVTRRLEELGRVAGVVVVDDYAHHPTEIEASIAACRVSYPGRRLIAAFQPHLFSRTRDFAAAFGVALAHADEVWVTDVYAAREAPVEGVSGALVADAARSAGAPAVRFVASLGELAAELVDSVPAGSVCLMMGAGDIDGAARQVLERLQGREGE
jgi:UDP-N-acetylmuramate--alanine ligase